MTFAPPDTGKLIEYEFRRLAWQYEHCHVLVPSRQVCRELFEDLRSRFHGITVAQFDSDKLNKLDNSEYVSDCRQAAIVLAERDEMCIHYQRTKIGSEVPIWSIHNTLAILVNYFAHTDGGRECQLVDEQKNIYSKMCLRDFVDLYPHCVNISGSCGH